MDGVKVIITRVMEENQSSKIVYISFSKAGIASIKHVISGLEETIKERYKSSNISRKKLSKAAEMEP